MKKLWAILLAVMMVVGTVALVSCGNTPASTTAESTTAKADTTTAGTTAKADTTTAVGTTAKADTTTAAGTTAKADTTTAAGTTAKADTTTAAATTAATQATEATTTTKEAAAEGTTLPIYARLDFGTNADINTSNGMRDHEWLLSVLSYNEAYLKLQWTEEELIVIAKVDYNAADETATRDDFALTFESLVDYVYEWEDYGFIPGWGQWDLQPYSDQYVGVDGHWGGDHQYMQIRLINNTKNNMISIGWSNATTPGYFTTLRCSNMYLQGGEGVNTCEPTTEYATYTYDVMFLNALASCRFNWGSALTPTGSLVGLVPDDVDCSGETVCYYFADYAAYKAARLEFAGWMGGNNYNKTRTVQENGGLRLYLLGAMDCWQSARVNKSICDSRDNIVAGAKVTVDYILFGSTPEQLDAYKSTIEA